MSKRYNAKPKIELPDLEPGVMVGDYMVKRRLDAGGMGTVYSGIHPVIGKRVAIKLLHPHVAQNPENIQRFKQEASVVNAIQDPGIVDIFAFGEHIDGRYYFVMEYLKGERLLEFLKRHGAISGYASAQLLRMLSLSMAAAHDKNVIHRDLKAENVFLVPSNDGHWPPSSKILDFGLAKLLLPLPGQTLPRTRQGVTLGTPYYMSPEQCQGKTVDARSDIYALGVLGFEMVMGHLPFMHKDPTEVMHMHLREIPALIHSSNRPKLFDELIIGCLEKNPDDRPQEMREVTTTLESIFPSLSPDFYMAPSEKSGGSRELKVSESLASLDEGVVPHDDSPNDLVKQTNPNYELKDNGADSEEVALKQEAKEPLTAKSPEPASPLELKDNTSGILKASPYNKMLLPIFFIGMLIGLILGIGIGSMTF